MDKGVRENIRFGFQMIKLEDNLGIFQQSICHKSVTAQGQAIFSYKSTVAFDINNY